MANERVSKFLDSRVVERYIHSGHVSEEDYKSFVTNLPDDTVNAQWVQLDLNDAEIGEATDLPIDTERDEEAT